MSREPGKHLAKIDPAEGLPDYLREYAENDESKETLKEHVRIPWLQILQGLSDQNLLSQYGQGAALLNPGGGLVAKAKDGASDPFYVVPVLFFTEYVQWSHREDNESPAVLNRSFDARSDLARKCKNPEEWEEKYTNPSNQEFLARNTEQLCFVCIIYDEDHPLHGMLCTAVFSKGSYKYGKLWINQINMRKGPLYCHIWRLNTKYQDDGPKKKFWRLDTRVPEEDRSSFVGKDDIQFFHDKHLELKEAFNEQRLIVDQEREETSAVEDSGDF